MISEASTYAYKLPGTYSISLNFRAGDDPLGIQTRRIDGLGASLQFVATQVA